ncbi:MAG: putative signal peptide protein [Parcubacteria group bacterium Gr01-1014_46]|nr:MAG: putative signal peptide protein [Parcubacteria group bacterium Gr01-1014_46]
MGTNTFELLFVIHYVSTLIMTGAIWLAQLSQYPLLVYVGRKNFIRYEHEHVRRISGIAWFIIYLELITSVLLLLQQGTRTNKFLWIAFILIVIIWLATWFIQYPIHKKLEQGFDKRLYRKLVSSNWIRTISWTIRSLILTYILSILL